MLHKESLILFQNINLQRNCLNFNISCTFYPDDFQPFNFLLWLSIAGRVQEELVLG